MTKFLIKKFIKSPDEIDSPSVRKSYGRLAGVSGIISNTALCLLKGLLGWFSGSIAILADAFNNLSDAASSIITLVGFKLASKECDKEHPYGHARMEYMTGIVIAAIIILLGFKMLSSSYEKILNKDPVDFNALTILLLLFAIGVKVWQAFFYYHLAKKIKSAALKAAGADSRNDVITTGAILLALSVGYFTGFNVDGYLGCLVAVFIMWSGVKMIKETSGPLLGQAPDPALVEKIEALILRKPAVLGVHDLVVHDYGPGRIFASVHIEVDAATDIMISHETVDEIERETLKTLRVELVGHMDPVDRSDPLLSTLKSEVKRLLENQPAVKEMHDLRIVRGEHRINVVFDVVLIPGQEDQRLEISRLLREGLHAVDDKFEAVITFDTSYTN